jgi:wobble nucleotide-excising tRNase
MLIKRIKSIKQVGAFYDFGGGGSVPFADQHRLTVVFGRNTHGKSTLAEIFSSVGNDDPTILDHRESIPSGSGLSRLVDISYVALDGTEKTAKLTTSWTANELTGNVFVFDEEFTHRNLMAGDTVTRDNREYFTDFILGEEGVDLSNQIEQFKKDIRLKKSGLSQLRPPSVSGTGVPESIVLAFVALTVEESPEQLRLERENHLKTIQRLGSAEEFLSLSLTSAKVESSAAAIKSLMDDTTTTLGSSYKDVSDAVREVLERHIADHCDGNSGAFNWLKVGHSLVGDETCPYCGGAKSAGNSELLNAYDVLFNEEFERHDSRIQSEVAQQSSRTSELLAANYPAAVQKTLEQVAQYEPFVSGIEVELGEFRALLPSILEAQDTTTELLKQWQLDVQKVQAVKQRAPHRELLKTFDESLLLASTEQIASLANEIDAIAARAKNRIDEARESIAQLGAPALEQERRKADEALKGIDRKMSRLSDDVQCSRYKEAQEGIEALETDLAAAHVRFEENQSEYLEHYFDDLNRLFGTLGSGDFSIGAESNRVGDKRVYSLVVKYKGVRIPPERLSRTLSESDKRSLALSLFLTKLDRIPNKFDKVVVFDDPVVSFDDNRIDASCILFKQLARDFGHVIVITHYWSVIAKFIRARAEASHIEIFRDATTAVLRIHDAKKAIMDPHERAFEKIVASVDAGGAAAGSRNLRPFMEDHLKLVFQKQIRENDLAEVSLSELIVGLNSVGAISNDVARELHDQREMMNPDHHDEADDLNPAAWCVNATNLLKLLYDDLFS